ncbi:hypothetical protein [Streptomyces ziwulingensis]|uniref:hypothetical protein n=1 Tax=Streptomyces ziwulingensis TaxID=1045501 RepID=UPI0031E91A76
MYRTTTTATLLVSVALSALTGCVTVQRPPVPDPATSGARPPAPRPDGPARPRAVQAPAEEALEMIGPAREGRPGRGGGPGHAGEKSLRAPEGAALPHRRPPAEATRPRAARPVPREPEPRTAPERRAPAPGSPAAPGAARGGGDVCGLGRKYGGWRAGSPESAICERTYGR